MGELEINIMIVSAIVPFCISMVKRFTTLQGNTVSVIAMVISFLVALLSSVFAGEFDYQDLPKSFLIAYGTSQLVFKGVMKTMNIDEKLEMQEGLELEEGEEMIDDKG